MENRLNASPLTNVVDLVQINKKRLQSILEKLNWSETEILRVNKKIKQLVFLSDFKKFTFLYISQIIIAILKLYYRALIPIRRLRLNAKQ